MLYDGTWGNWWLPGFWEVWIQLKLETVSETSAVCCHSGKGIIILVLILKKPSALRFSSFVSKFLSCRRSEQREFHFFDSAKPSKRNCLIVVRPNRRSAKRQIYECCTAWRWCRRRIESLFTFRMSHDFTVHAWMWFHLRASLVKLWNTQY